MAPDKNGHPAESPPGAVNNQGLFSDYYLTALVPEDEFFRASSAGSAHSPRRRAELACHSGPKVPWPSTKPILPQISRKKSRGKPVNKVCPFLATSLMTKRQ